MLTEKKIHLNGQAQKSAHRTQTVITPAINKRPECIGVAYQHAPVRDLPRSRAGFSPVTKGWGQRLSDLPSALVLVCTAGGQQACDRRKFVVRR